MFLLSFNKSKYHLRVAFFKGPRDYSAVLGVSIPIGFAITGVIIYVLVKKKKPNSNITNPIPLSSVSSDSAYASNPGYYERCNPSNSRQASSATNNVEYLRPIFPGDPAVSSLLEENPRRVGSEPELLTVPIEQQPLIRGISVDLKAQIMACLDLYLDKTGYHLGR